jgi:hypothetical protein
MLRSKKSSKKSNHFLSIEIKKNYEKLFKNQKIFLSGTFGLKAQDN